MEAGKTRTDRRRVRTRSALIGAGQHLFANRPIDGVTIDEIVAVADVAKGSFYNHFDGKQSLADTIVDLVQGDCEREVYAVNDGIDDAAIRAARAVAALIRYAQHHPDRYRAMVNLTRRHTDLQAPINTGMRHDVQTGLASGQFHSITLEGGMLACLALIANTIDYLAATEGRTSPERVATETAFMLLRALGVENENARSVATAAVDDLFRQAGD